MTGKSRTPWPDGNVAILKRLWAEGLSATQIAAQLNKSPIRAGVTRNAVLAKIDRLGIQKRAKIEKSARSGEARVATVPAKKIRALMAKPKSEPFHEHGAEMSDQGVPFNARRTNQCPRFVGEQAGSTGLICGRPSTHGSWCEACSRAVWIGKRAVEAA